jgi:DNA-binding response OmpR family regulator
MNTILLLEDDISLNQTVSSFLEMNGFKILSAYNGEDALDLAYENSIDLMLIDVKVPKINGFEFLEEIRKNDTKTPAIFITSLNSADDVEKGFGLGCDDYIRKPFELKELLVRVNSQLSRVYGSTKDSIQIDKNIEFNPKELQLIKDNQKVSLKTKEAKLLELFLKNRDRLLEYEEINQALWDWQEEPSSGALRTYIKNLRLLIGKEKIETIKNVGYRFVTK